MSDITLTQDQAAIAHSTATSIHLAGPNGCGKTTTALARLDWLVDQGVLPSQVLILVPQRTLGVPYMEHISKAAFPAGGQPTVITFGGLARRMTELFWPLAGHLAGFTSTKSLPRFLTLESAQFYMAEVVEPLILSGCFDSVALERSRLYAQILDNLNKAASIGFSYLDIGQRLSDAWVGSSSQLHIFADTQKAASAFRQYCLEKNLLDYSLQLETFTHFIWPNFIGRQYLANAYTHLIWDNVEEDIPIAHDLIADWMPELESVFLIRDTNGGYRTFLGADPISAKNLGDRCVDHFTLTVPFLLSEEMQLLETTFESAILRPSETIVSPNFASVFTLAQYRLIPEMARDTAAQVAQSISEGTDPSDIVILAPYMPDALRFSLQHEMTQLGIPNRSHRPSRSLRDEPVVHTLLTLAKLVFKSWQLLPRPSEVRQAFMQVITDGDLIRADLLTRTVFRTSYEPPCLSAFASIDEGPLRDRITYHYGDRFDRLRQWLTDAVDDDQELDIFLSRLFGEVLSQPGFGYYQNIEAAILCSRLIESIRKFRLATNGIYEGALGSRYITLLSEGVLAAQSLPAWYSDQAAVLLAPAYTFLMSNQTAHVQFWLDAGSAGWWQRLDQPLTHPYVLSRIWTPGQPWTDRDEVAYNQQNLKRLITGLIRRCTSRIVMSTVAINEQGEQETGALLLATQRILRQVARMEAGDHV